MSLSSILNKLKKMVGNSLIGEISLYCEICNRVVIISEEERKKLGIYNPEKDLKILSCPICNVPYGKKFYLYDYSKE
ncbi:MAG: hypothetical protein QW040_02775 [Candidatus Aenigmatarchaeota archaeon]